MINELFTSPYFLMFVFLIMSFSFVLFKHSEWVTALKKRQEAIEAPIVKSFDVAVKNGIIQGEYEDWLRLIGLEDKKALEIYHKCSKAWSIKHENFARKIKAIEILTLISCLVVVFSMLFGLAQAFNIMRDVSIDELKRVNEVKLAYEFELNNEKNSNDVKHIISNQLKYVEHAIASDDKITTVEYDRILDAYNAYRLKNFSVEYKKYVEKKSEREGAINAK